MANDIIVDIKEDPIILQYTKQGIEGPEGPVGPQGNDGTSWELVMTMDNNPNGTCDITLYENGEVCKDTHYITFKRYAYNGTKWVTPGWNRAITGTVKINYTDTRAIHATVFDSSALSYVLCSNSVNLGRAATVKVGTVTSGATPKVTNSGNDLDAVLNFTFEKGDAATVRLDETNYPTQKLAFGANPWVQNRGTANDAILQFGIPKGGGCGAYVSGSRVILEPSAMFTPSVSSTGALSWTNNVNISNPSSVQITLNPKGAWSNSTAYSRLDLVTNEGNSYVALKAVPSGTALTSTSYWMKLTEKGDKGDIATITMGTTTALTEGSTPTVTNTGTSSDAVLNFGIPKGPKGDAAKVYIGSVTTLNSDADATVTNTGTEYNAVLNFGIPRGPAGIEGTSVPWGGILGDMSAQGDLTTALNSKLGGDQLAPAYNPSQNWAVGSYCIYGGKLYKFTSAHTGDWNASKATEISAMGELDLKANADSYLPLTGGTLSNVLYNSHSYVIQSNINPSSPNPNATTWSNGFYIRDVNGNTISAIRAFQTNSNQYALRFALTRNVNGEDVTHVMYLTLAADGTKSVTLEREPWLRALFPSSLGSSANYLAAFTTGYASSGYVGLPLSIANGGTGASTATANRVFAAPNGSNGAPSFRALVAADLPTVTVAKGGTGVATASANRVFAGPSSGSTATAPSFRALVAADIPNLAASKITSGTLSVGTSGNAATATKLAQDRRFVVYLGTAYDASGSATAKGLYSLDGNVNIPVTGNLGVDHGGTGGSDSGWQTLTNTSVYTGTVYYRKLGKICYVTTDGINLKADLAGNNSKVLATIPSGYRPAYTIGEAIGVNGNHLTGKVTIATTGKITILSSAGGQMYGPNAIGASATLHFNFTYLLA